MVGGLDFCGGMLLGTRLAANPSRLTVQSLDSRATCWIRFHRQCQASVVVSVLAIFALVLVLPPHQPWLVERQTAVERRSSAQHRNAADRETWLHGFLKNAARWPATPACGIRTRSAPAGSGVILGLAAGRGRWGDARARLFNAQDRDVHATVVSGICKHRWLTALTLGRLWWCRWRPVSRSERSVARQVRESLRSVKAPVGQLTDIRFAFEHMVT
jgi:hypothetical protein